MADPIEITAPVTIPAAIEITAPVTIGGIGGGGSGASWGSITGTLSSQTDLQAALDAKAASGHTHAQLHDPVTVTGNGITLTGQQIALSIGTGATQVAQGNHSHTPASIGAVAATLTRTNLAANHTLAPSDNGKCLIADAAITISVPSSGMDGMRVWLIADVGSITFSGASVGDLRAEGLEYVTTLTVSDGFCELINMGGVWKIIKGVPDKLAGSAKLTAITESVVALGTVVSAATIDISAGTHITATLTATTECTFTMPTAAAGKSFILYLKQAASTGNGTAVFPGVVWSGGTAPTITAAAGKMDIISFVSGPNAAGTGYTWYASAVQNLTPP